MEQERFVFVDDQDRTAESARGSVIIGLFITGVSLIGLIMVAIKGEFNTGFPGDWNMVLFFLVGVFYIVQGATKKGLRPRFVEITKSNLLLKLSLTGKTRSIDLNTIRSIEHDNREFRVVTNKEVIPLPFTAFSYRDIQSMKKRFAEVSPSSAEVA